MNEIIQAKMGSTRLPFLESPDRCRIPQYRLDIDTNENDGSIKILYQKAGENLDVSAPKLNQNFAAAIEREAK
ncbi:hypothetical protein BTW01_15060 [Bacillus sp. SKDU12]|nr:hypothetical protein BTW01_15060 [Bacillus sp. SKDU12]